MSMQMESPRSNRRTLGPTGSGRSRRTARSAATATMAPAVPRRIEFSGTSAAAQLINCGSRLAVRTTLAAWASEPRLPWPAMLLDQAFRLLPGLCGTRTTAIRLPNCRAEWIVPTHRDSDATAPVVLYFHGGGFLAGGLNTHRRLAGRVGRACDADLLAVDYRLLPGHSVDEAIRDGLDAYEYLLDLGYPSTDIVLAGDSAGAFLSFAVALAVRDNGLPMPGGIAALSPLTDLDPTLKLAHANADTCAVIPANALRRLIELSDRADARRGVAGNRVSPVDADLRGLPPVLLQVGSTEIFLPDAELMADRLAAAGVDCELQIWQNQVHVFHITADLVPEAARAIDAVGTWFQTLATGAGDREIS